MTRNYNFLAYVRYAAFIGGLPGIALLALHPLFVLPLYKNLVLCEKAALANIGKRLLFVFFSDMALATIYQFSGMRCSQVHRH